MEKNKQFLIEIFKGAKMGTESIETLLPKCKDTQLKAELKRQKKEYQAICNEVSEFMDEMGIDTQNPPFIAQASSWLNIQMSTLFDKSTSNIAEKLMTGNLMGVIGITKILNKFDGDIDQSYLKYSERFIDACEQNIKNLKPFLE